MKYWDKNLKEIDSIRAASEGTYFGLEDTPNGFSTCIAYAGELVFLDSTPDYGAAVDRIMTYHNFLAEDDSVPGSGTGSR
ncbi:MAG: hypothetical protein KKA32_18495 [Actinobacteria bacterium]|nr:hypothetical protein [Actinomycetota bacterium]